jgi:hypothetical protein
MKLKTICYGLINSSRIINRFGNAWLIQMADRQFRLVGGSPDDLAAAEEWASLFAHEIVFSQSQIRRRRSGSGLETCKHPKLLPH